MTTENFKYDVAFSFVHKDEGLASELYKLLKDRISCFIYSEQQKRLAGANGEQEFNSVFSKESRIVVVLFSNEWGKTKWTMIEETAIRNKGYEEGYDFVLIIPTDDKFTLPNWLPKNRIWIGLERWGIESAASAIETRVQEFGGQVKIESIADRVAREELEIREKQKREQLLQSQEGFTMAFKEVENVVNEIKKHEEEIKSKVTNWLIKVRDNNYSGCDIICYGYYLTIQFHKQWDDSSDGAYLYIALFKGYFDENGHSTNPFQENEKIGMTRVRFDINEFNQTGWTLIETRKDFMETNKLVELWFAKLITLATEEKKKRNY